MSDFSDRPFIAGSVTGLRAFRVDPLGRLTGVTYQEVWRPGENVASCLKKDDDDLSRYIAGGYIVTPSPSQTSYSSTLSRILGMSPPAVVASREQVAAKVAEKVKTEHAPSGVKCTCGFYAYFDGRNDYLGGNPFGADYAPRIAAVIEGYGVCTVGSRGFRAEKAKIVALVAPKNADAKLAALLPRVIHNYPDAAIFSKKSTALREFPLTDPLAEFTPESDPDFWTRSAS